MAIAVTIPILVVRGGGGELLNVVQIQANVF